ncbi:MAG: tetratricopeptide repeat protein [Dongiaceae bacterium]
MATYRIWLSSAVALALCVAVPAGMASAASSGGESSSSSGGSSSSKQTVASAKAKVEAGKYAAAIKILEDIVDDNPKNADAWNLLGYSHRKLGDYDDALEYYEKALTLKPDHVGANEYLGELYLEMKDLPKAEERLAVLAKACNGCEEQKELEEKIADFKANNS